MNEKYMVMAGCGKLGSFLANRLSSNGHSIVIIDKNPAAFERLSFEFTGFKLEGDVSLLSVLQKAKVADAYAFWALTENDNLNLMIAQTAKSFFKVDKVFARIHDPEKSKIFQDSEIFNICPTILAGEKALSIFAEELKTSSEDKS
jgi:trk system potassium uptake protein TrkA